MALADIIVSFDIHQLLGADFDPRRTKAYVKTNVANATLMDTSTGETRIGDQAVTIAADGTGTWTTWAPGPDGNPTSWQETLVLDYPRTGQRDRAVRSFGPYTITGNRTVAAKQLASNVASLFTDAPHGIYLGASITVSGVGAPFDGTFTVTGYTSTEIRYAVTAADVPFAAATGTVFSERVTLAVLEEEQAVPAEYLTKVTAQLDAHAADLEDTIASAAANVTTDVADAEAAKSAAQTSEAAAAGSAAAASTSATTATTKAAEASTSADEADTSATTAATAATTATTKAGEAASSATAAAASASHADAMAGAVEAVSVTNDTIMAAVAANPTSAFAIQQSASIAVPGLAPAKVSQFPPVWVEKFNAGHGWTISGGGDSSVTDDTLSYALAARGVQSAKVSIPIPSTNRDFSRTGAYSFDATGKAFVVWVKFNDHTRIDHIQLWAGTDAGTSFTNRFILRTWIGHGSTSIGPTTNGRWTPIWFHFNSNDNQATTGSPNRARITDLRLRFYTNATVGAGAPAEVTVGAIGLIPENRSSIYPNGVLTFTFDDGYQSQYIDARAILDTYRFPATHYMIAERADASVVDGITLAQLKTLRDVSGWEIAGHAFTQVNHDGRLTAITGSALEAEVASLKQWLVANGFQSDDFCYPGGYFNDEVLDVVGRYFSTARTTMGTPPWSMIPPLDPLLINMYDPSSGGASSVANAKLRIDNTIAVKGWTQFMIHRIGSGGIPAADLQAIVDYAYASGIAVETVKSVMTKARLSGFGYTDNGDGTAVFVG